MKKASLFLLFLFIITCNSFAQSILQEGFENGVMPPDGWTAVTESNAYGWSGWHRTQENKHSGAWSARVNYSNGENYYHSSYLITPQLHLTGHKLLSFWYAGDYTYYSTATDFTVEISTTGDTSDFVVLEQVYFPLEDLVFFNMVIDLEEYSGQDVYLAFHVYDRYGTSVYLDDIEIYDAPICFAPEYISLLSSGLNSASLSWSSSGEGNTYVLEYKLSDDPWSSAGTLTTSSTNASLGGLMPASRYQARVKTICSGEEESAWSSTFDFATSCQALTVTTEQPWIEDFEGFPGGGATHTPLSVCWSSLISPYNYSTPDVLCGYSYAAHSGSNSLMMSGDAQNVNMVTLPEFTNDLNTLRFSFYGASTESTVAAAGRLEVGYVTDPDDPDTYVPVEVVEVNDSALSRQYCQFGPYDFFGLPDDASRMVIKFTSSTWNTSWNLDDFVVSLIPECTPPTRLSLLSLTTTTAQIYWAGWNDLTYDILYWEDGSFDTTVISGVAYSNLGYTLTDLASSTHYKWMVRTYCSDGTLMCSPVSSFTTVGETQSLPYSRTFEEGDGAPEITFSGTGNNQWFVGSATGNPSDGSTPPHSMYISNDNGQTNIYGATVSNAYAVLNVTFPDLPYEYHLNFDYKLRGENGYDMFYVYMVNAGTNITPTYSYNELPESFPGTMLLDRESFVSEWTSVDMILEGVAGTTKQIVFYWYNDASVINNPPVAVDNISIDYFACPSPSWFTVDEVGSNDALVSWTETGSATSWKVYYKPKYSNSPYQEQIVNAQEAVLTDLYSNTEYECYVVSDCGDGEFSAHSRHSFFRTTCGDEGIATLPFVEDFSNFELLSDQQYPMYALCWTRLGNAYPYQVYVNASDYPSDPPLDFGYTPNSTFTMAVLPVFSESIPLNSLVIDMDVRRANLQMGTLEIGTLLVPDDATTFQAIDTIRLVSVNTWEHFTIYTNHYEGDARYLAIRAKGAGMNNQVLVDNLRIDNMPDCVPADGLSVSDVTVNSATLTWSGNGSEYEVYLINSNDTVVMSVTDNTLTLNDLHPSTSYVVLVKTICGSDEAPLSNPFVFSTECGAITITETTPWLENFESYRGIAEYAIPLSSCWATPLTMSASNGVFPAAYRYQVAAHSGYNVLEIKGANTMFVLPEFENDLNTLRFSMWANTNSNVSAGVGLMEVGVVMGTDASTFVPVDTVDITALSLTGHDSPMADLMGPYDFLTITPQAGQRIAVRYHCVDQESCYLDDFEVSIIPECASPVKNSVVVSDISDQYAQVSWVDHDQSHDSWTVYYKVSTAGDDAWQSVVAENTPSVVLEGLTSITPYDVYVVSNCDGPGTDATVVRHFTTTMSAAVLPYTADFSNSSEWLFLNSTCNNRWMSGPVSGYGGGNGLFISQDGSTPGYNQYYASLVVAEKVFTVGNSEAINISFDVVVGGESVYDYLKVFFTSSTFEFNEVGSSYMYNSDLPTWATTYYSTDAISFQSVAPNTSTPYILSSTGSNPLHVTVTMPNPNASPSQNSTAKLAFMWYNDSFMSDDQPGAVIKNLTVSVEQCPAPINMQASHLNANSAEISWEAGANVDEYLLAYRSEYETDWTELDGLTSNSYVITGLEPTTNYTVRVASLCSGSYSDYSYVAFITPNCDTADQCLYTMLMSDSGNDGWNGGYIEVKQYGKTIATMTVPAGQSSSQRLLPLCSNVATTLIWHPGTYDYECSCTLLGPDGTVIYQEDNFYIGDFTFNFTTHCPGVSNCQTPIGLQANDVTTHVASIGWTDNESVESWEVEYKKASAQNWTLAGLVESNGITLTGLSLHTSYMVRVKAICNSLEGDESSWSQAISFMTADSVALPVVVTYPADNITYNSAKLHGRITELGNQDIIMCGFEWKESGSGEYQLATTTGANMASNLTNLNPATVHVFRAFASTPDTTVYGEELTFTTLEAPVPCPTPTNLMQTNVTENTLTVSWVDNAEADHWQVRYRANEQDWITREVHNTPTCTITGLTSGTSYEVQVRAICSANSYSAWTISSIFTTIGLNEYLQSQVVLYPNPAKEIVNVQCTMNNVPMDGAEIEVLDVYGKLLQTLKVSSEITQINVSGLADGMYFVRVTMSEGVVTKRFVKK